MNRAGWRLFLLGTFTMMSSYCLSTRASSRPQAATLTREYRDGEIITYRMNAVNEGHLGTLRYQAQASGRVNREPSGSFVEKFAWTSYATDGHFVPLTPASQQFRQDLSLSPEYKLSVPNLTKVQPMLIGPITDLLTIYADVQLAMRQQNLVRAGDHVYVKYGTPASWADGTYTLFGQDSIDFDITLRNVDRSAHQATLEVRHVPPVREQIQFPATWMAAPIGSLPNNWAQVEKIKNTYSAETGEESFQDVIKISLPSGRILSAEIENPVDVVSRDCKDAALSHCGAPVRYHIRRHISLTAPPG